MAKCPSCGMDWKWDWCQDALRSSRDKLARIHTFENDEFRSEISFCECGMPIGVDIFSNTTEENYNQAVFDLPEWSEVDWEEESWPEV